MACYGNIGIGYGYSDYSGSALDRIMEDARKLGQSEGMKLGNDLKKAKTQKAKNQKTQTPKKSQSLQAVFADPAMQKSLSSLSGTAKTDSVFTKKDK